MANTNKISKPGNETGHHDPNIIELSEHDGQGASALDILSQMSGDTKTKSKSKVPVIDDKEFTAIVDEAIELHEAVESAKTSYDLVKRKVLTRIRTEYDKNKGLTSSFKLQGTKKAVLVSFKNQFKQIPIESKTDIEKALEDDYSKYFTDVYELSLKDTSIAKIQEIINLVGAEKFKEVFEIKKSYIKASDNMNTLQFELPPLVKLAVEQYEGSVKI